MPLIDYRSGFILGVSVLVGAAAAGLWWMKERKGSSCANMLDGLENTSVRIKDREKVDRLIHEFINGGHQKLQVIADFDRTLSRFRTENGETVATCHNVLESSHTVSSHYHTEAVKLRDYYYAIEIDDSLTKEQKYPFMVEWWTKAHDLLVECGLTQGRIASAVRESNIVLRQHSDWLLQELHKFEVPLLIFSAGLGDIIEEVVRQQHTLFDNIRVVSNYMDFNNQGQLVGFKGELIHIYNKNENAIHNSDYFENLQHRENILLLGDSLGDLNMADGAVESANILKVGFLNDKVQERLPVYMDSFDIVLVSDETMDVPNALLKKILESL